MTGERPASSVAGTTANPGSATKPDQQAGLVYGVVTYIMWGLFPLYFTLLDRSPYFEIISYRVIFSFLLAVLLVTVLRQWGDIRALVANRRSLLTMLLAGLLVTVNWSVYVYGVNSGRALDAAMGYFINPLISMMLGVVVNKEKMRPGQWLSFAIGMVAVVVMWVGLGDFPVIALGVAFSFGFYGLIKNRVGMSVKPVPGLALETSAPLPIVAAYLVWLHSQGGATGYLDTGYGWLMAASGVVTLVPLILFAAAAQRITMLQIGFLQYISPVMQFFVGWLILGEDMSAMRWAGFIIVWLAVAVYLADAVRHHRKVGRNQRNGGHEVRERRHAKVRTK